MSIDLLYSRTTTVLKHYDPTGILPTTATATLEKSDGTDSGYAGAVTLPTASTTVSGSTSTRTTVVVASASGFSVGDHIRVTTDGVKQVGEITRIDGTTLHLMSALALVPDASDAVALLDMSVQITGLAVTDVATNYRIVWEYDDGTDYGYHADTAHVVRWLWERPASPDDIAEHVAFAFKSVRRSQGYYERIASLVDRKIRQLVEATGKRAALYGDPEVFSEAGMLWARVQLAREGLVPVGSNPGLYQRDLHLEFNESIAASLGSLAVYDADNSGTITDDEAAGRWRVGTLRR